MAIGGDDGGVCMGPAIEDMASGVVPDQWLGGRDPRLGLQWSPLSLSGGVNEPGSMPPPYRPYPYLSPVFQSGKKTFLFSIYVVGNLK